MVGFLTPMEKVKQLITELQRLENRLNGSGMLSMREQHTIQTEIKRVKEEIARLEGRRR